MFKFFKFSFFFLATAEINKSTRKKLAKRQNYISNIPNVLSTNNADTNMISAANNTSYNDITDNNFKMNYKDTLDEDNSVNLPANNLSIQACIDSMSMIEETQNFATNSSDPNYYIPNDSNYNNLQNILSISSNEDDFIAIDQLLNLLQ
jgi:hypothetical protein